MYEKSENLTNAAGNVAMRVARFDISEPGVVRNITLTMDGEPDTFTVRLFGHEGGTSFPQLLNDLVPPMQVVKSGSGKEDISIEISDKVELRNNQFFVALEDLSSSCYIKQTIATHPAPCTSTSGGTYYYQFLQLTNGNWSASTRVFAISVQMDVTPLPAQPHFTDITDTADIAGSGDRIATADINGDGLIDILQGGQLLINDWWNSHKFKNITASSGISGNPRANAFLDMNNDGHLDILFLDANDSCFIFMNNGNTTFTKTWLKGIPIKALDRINTISISDINNDKLPDFFCGQLWETYPNALPKFLFVNDGNNDFTDQTDLLYKSSANLKNAPCRGSQFVDFNNDGCPDLFVANYVTTASKSTSPRDELWLNNGDGTFTNVIDQTGIDTTIGAAFWNMSSGCHWSDFDNDGDMDLLAPTLSHPRYMNGNGGEYTNPTTIYRNDLNQPGDISFTNLAGQHNIQYEETHAGATWGDFNNDGLLDFFISTFYGCRFWDVYVQLPNGTFELVTQQTGLNTTNGNQDGLWLDFNNDGKLDLMAGGRLYQNTGPYYGYWVELQPKSSSANNFAIGSRVIVYTKDHQYTREVTSGRGQKMQRPFRLHFGLNYASKIDSVKVIWPGCDQKATVYTNINLNSIYVLNENGTSTLATPTLSTAQLVVSPNPFSNTIRVKSDGRISDVVMHDLMGKNIPCTIISKSGETVIEPLAKTAKGIYVLQICLDGNWVSQKVIRE